MDFGVRLAALSETFRDTVLHCRGLCRILGVILGVLGSMLGTFRGLERHPGAKNEPPATKNVKRAHPGATNMNLDLPPGKNSPKNGGPGNPKIFEKPKK